jgi:ketosteroid isomerase-like protein
MTDSALKPIDPASLPEAVTAYLRAHAARDTPAALAAFTPDASVTDDGRTHEGTAAIESWLTTTVSAYTYTTTLIGAHRADDAHYVVDHRLEGDFPGGVVDLHFRFTLRGAAVERLVIEP